MLTVLGAVQAQAGAWNQDKNHGQIIITGVWSDGSVKYDDDFDTVNIRDFSKTETRIYVEHGLTDRLTFVGNAAYQNINFTDVDSSFSYDGLDRTELGVQWQLARKQDLAVAVKASYIIDSNLPNSAVDVFSVGDMVELRGLIGQSRETSKGDFFYNAEFALRTADFDRIDSFHGEIALGWKPDDRHMILLQNYANMSPEVFFIEDRNPEQIQFQSQLSIMRRDKKGRGMQIGVQQTWAGRNIVKETALTVGSWLPY